MERGGKEKEGEGGRGREGYTHTSRLVRRIGMRMINTIQRKYETGGKATSRLGSSFGSPPETRRKNPSNSYSPLVMVMVLTIESAGVENGVRCTEIEGCMEEREERLQCLLKTFFSLTCTCIFFVPVWRCLRFKQNKSYVLSTHF